MTTDTTSPEAVPERLTRAALVRHLGTWHGRHVNATPAYVLATWSLDELLDAHAALHQAWAADEEADGEEVL